MIPPSGRVPGQCLLAALILKRRWRWYRGVFANMISIFRVSSSGVKIGAKGGTERDHREARRPPGATGWGRARDPSGVPVVTPSPSLVIPEASRTLIFYIIFPEFLEHF